MTTDFNPPQGFERRVRIGVALNHLCPCCSRDVEAPTYPLTQEGYTSYVCLDCGCVFAQVEDGAIAALGSGLSCQGVTRIARDFKTRGGI